MLVTWSCPLPHHLTIHLLILSSYHTYHCFLLNTFAWPISTPLDPKLFFSLPSSSLLHHLLSSSEKLHNPFQLLLGAQPLLSLQYSTSVFIIHHFITHQAVRSEMAAVAAMLTTRQPFLPLGEWQLRNLANVKNCQNGMSSLASFSTLENIFGKLKPSDFTLHA